MPGLRTVCSIFWEKWTEKYQSQCNCGQMNRLMNKQVCISHLAKAGQKCPYSVNFLYNTFKFLNSEWQSNHVKLVTVNKDITVTVSFIFIKLPKCKAALNQNYSEMFTIANSTLPIFTLNMQPQNLPNLQYKEGSLCSANVVFHLACCSE